MNAAGTLTATLDEIASWVESEIAANLEYLVPPDEGAVEDIELTWSNPSVFSSFVPSVERLPEGSNQSPSILVQLLGGEDSLSEDRELRIRLLLTIWSPGHFVDGSIIRSNDGWRDLFNGLSAIVTAVESAETIAGCAVKRDNGVRYGFYEIDRQIPDMYPYWMGQVDFELRRLPHANKRFNTLL
mgnify:CR=1 FL=1